MLYCISLWKDIRINPIVGMLKPLAGMGHVLKKPRVEIVDASIEERRVISLGNVLKKQIKAVEDVLTVARKAILLVNVKNLEKIIEEVPDSDLVHASIVAKMVISLVNDPGTNQANL